MFAVVLGIGGMTRPRSSEPPGPPAWVLAPRACRPLWTANAAGLALSLVALSLVLQGRGLGSARAAPPGPRLVASPRDDADVLKVQFSADGRTLATQDSEGVTLWEVATWRARASARPPESQPLLASFALSPDGRSVAAPVRGRLRVWDLPAAKSRVFEVRTKDTSRLAFSPDGKTLAVDLEDKDVTVKLLDAADGKERTTLRGKTHIRALAFSPDSQTLAAAEGGGDVRSLAVVRLWDVASGRERATLGGYGSSPIWSVAFSPDGKALATVSNDDTIRVWDTATGRLRVSWEAGLRGSYCVGFSPDGRILVAGGFQAIKFWEAASGKELQTVEGYRGSARSLALSPDGRLLAVAWEAQPTAKVWDVSTVTGRPAPDLPPAQDGERTGSAVSPPDQAGKPTAEELERLWSHLAGEDAERAYRAIWALAEAPRQAVPFLAKQLKPDSLPEPKQTAPLLADLDSSDFAVRQQAAQALEELADRAGPALRRELKEPRSAEVRRQVEQLLEKLEQGPPPAERLRALRALEALEHAGTPESRRLLRTLAEGPPETRLTQQARFALDRLARRAAAAP